jgi:hypothetical protein
MDFLGILIQFYQKTSVIAVAILVGKLLWYDISAMTQFHQTVGIALTTVLNKLAIVL